MVVGEEGTTRRDTAKLVADQVYFLNNLLVGPEVRPRARAVPPPPKASARGALHMSTLSRPGSGSARGTGRSTSPTGFRASTRISSRIEAAARDEGRGEQRMAELSVLMNSPPDPETFRNMSPEEQQMLRMAWRTRCRAATRTPKENDELQAKRQAPRGSQAQEGAGAHQA